MSIRFDGQVAVVTGAGRGLGRAHALALAARGARVVVNDPGADLRGEGAPVPVADAVVAEIAAAGGTAVASRDDVGDATSAALLVELALDTFGRLDVLVNNAGIMRDKVFKKMDLADFEKVVRVHLLGSAYVTRHAFPHMIRQDFGRVLMTTSAAGLYGAFGGANYAAAKLGIVGLTKSLSIEGARHNVLVNAIAPVAASRMSEALLAPAEFARMTPDHVVPAALMLCARDCCLTGQVLEVGAGYCAKVDIVEGHGLRYPADRPPAPEMLAARYAEVADMRDACSFTDALALVRHVASSGGTGS